LAAKDALLAEYAVSGNWRSGRAAAETRRGDPGARRPRYGRSAHRLLQQISSGWCQPTTAPTRFA